MKRLSIFALVPILLLGLAGCFRQIPPTNTSTYNINELKYRLFSEFNVFWVNPYLWPLVREGQEQQDALAQYSAIRADAEEFAAIANYLSLTIKDDYTDAEKLLIFRQHEKLSLAVQMTPSADGYDFVLREGEGQGWRYEGKINARGVTVITRVEPSFNTYPICLSRRTLIATPEGERPVEMLEPGMKVYSQDGTGHRIVVDVVRTSKTAVPSDFKVITLVLRDGRTLTASPDHPSAVGKLLGDYIIGDEIDGSSVAYIELHPYAEAFTYDILPDGDTALYWANGILLGSTLVE